MARNFLLKNVDLFLGVSDFDWFFGGLWIYLVFFWVFLGVLLRGFQKYNPPILSLYWALLKTPNPRIFLSFFKVSQEAPKS
jgi:hypothetical protein